jgi:preprotein translocase SecE subunit
MARDRKRAKQRQRRRAQQPGQEPVQQPAESGAPDPLEHASADADIARMAEASAQEPGAPDGPLEPDEYPQPDELRGADALDHPSAAPVKGSRADRTGADLPREGNRFINFLRACVAELRRVQWPDRRQVGQATGVVLGFVLVAGGYLGLLDAIFSRLVNAIL